MDDKMAFHNFSRLISRCKRPIQILPKIDGALDTDTTRYRDGGYGAAINVEGVFETITEKDYKRFPDYQLENANMKITATPDMLRNHIPKVKDKIVYNDRDFWVHKVANNVHYGNYYIIFLTKEEFKA